VVAIVRDRFGRVCCVAADHLLDVYPSPDLILVATCSRSHRADAEISTNKRTRRGTRKCRRGWAQVNLTGVPGFTCPTTAAVVQY